MSVIASGQEQPRLLPAAIESSARNAAIRTLGSALVGFAVLSWISLLSWSVSDPSLAGVAAKPVKNLLGAPGAAFSDFLINSIGAASILVLIGPMIWGLEMLSSMRLISRLHVKALLLPLGMLLLAGAFSSLPTIKAWPLHNGFGGMLGDLVFNLFATAAHRASQEWAGVIAATALLALGLPLFVGSLGLGLRDLLSGFGIKTSDKAPEAVRDTKSAGADEGAAEAAEERIVAAPALEPAHTLAMPEPVAREEYVPAPASRGSGFDLETEEHAQALAERFAPNAKAAESARAQKVIARTAEPIRSVIAYVRKSGGYRKPRLDLLKRPAVNRQVQEVNRSKAQANARQLEAVLADYGVAGEVKAASPGPVVTRYEFEPQRGIKISRIVGLGDDVARSMGARSVRIAVIPGRKAIGIEVPNDEREAVQLREILESETFSESPAALPIALGKSIAGDVVVADLARMPHLLVAGTTGSGKSVGINAMILSLLFKLDPSQCRLLLIDPKMLELAHYNGIPHLLAPVITDAQEAAAALEWAVGEMEERYQRMAKLGVRNIEMFNTRVHNAKVAGRSLTRTVQTGFDPRSGQAIYEQEALDGLAMPYIVVVVDEFADLMLQAGKRVEPALQRLAHMARAAGIHLVMATQRPSVDVVTGTIKANFPMRLSFRVASRIDSRTILGDSGAEQLLGAGDMLLSAGSGQLLRVHGAYVSDDELECVIAALRDQGEPAYVPDIATGGTTAHLSVHHDAGHAEDEDYHDAVGLVLADRKVSPGHLHRQLGIDEDLAERLIERMEREGLVGPVNRFGRREIFMTAPVAPELARRAAVA